MILLAGDPTGADASPPAWKTVIGLVHLFDHCTRDLSHNGHSGAINNGRRIKKFLVQRQKSPLRMHAIQVGLWSSSKGSCNTSN